MLPGDSIEISFTLLNLNGLTNLDTFQWKTPVFTPTLKEDVLTYNRNEKYLFRKDRKAKQFCNPNRICELEDAVVEGLKESERDVPKMKICT